MDPSAPPAEPARAGSTYRLQVHGGFGFDRCGRGRPYLHDLGVSHAYLSPVLMADAGSMHGYDVVDHGQISAGAGWPRRLRAAGRQRCTRHGLGAVVDVVPNHMAVPTPACLNAAALVGAARRAGLAVRRVVRRGLVGGPGRAADAGAGLADRPGAGRGRAAARPGGRPGRRRAGAALLRPPVPAAARHRGPAAGRAGRPAVVPAGALAGRRRGAELPAVLRRRHAGRGPGGGPEVFGPTHRLLLDLVAAARSTGCGSTTRTASPTLGATWPSWPSDRRRLGRGREDPGGRRAAAPGLAVRRAPPGTTCCGGSAGSSSTARAPRPCQRWPTSSPARAGLADVRRAGQARGRRGRLVRRGAPAGRPAGRDLPRRPGLRDHTRRGLHDSVTELLVAMDRYRAYVVPGEPARRRRAVGPCEARPTGRAPTCRSTSTTRSTLVRDLVLGAVGDPGR